MGQLQFSALPFGDGGDVTVSAPTSVMTSVAKFAAGSFVGLGIVMLTSQHKKINVLEKAALSSIFGFIFLALSPGGTTTGAV